MASVNIVFRNDSSEGAAIEPAPGEIHVRPRSASEQDRSDYATLVLEQGLDALAKGPAPIGRIVVLIGPISPTLDDMLAATFAMRLASGELIPDGAKAFARYSALARRGLQPSKIPIEASLEGIFLAIRNSVDDDLTDPETAAQFLAGWFRMFDRILVAAEKREDPFSTALFNEGSEFADERAFLVKEHEVYCQDVKRGQQWLIRFPSESPANSAGKLEGKRTFLASHLAQGQPFASALILDRPKSLLFKYWARIDRNSPTADGYLLLGVCWSSGQWVFSTDPVQRLSLKPLAERLQKAEERETLQSAEAKADPWFDGNRFKHSLIAAPKRGTCLPQKKVLSVVKQWGHAVPARRGIRRHTGPILAGCLLLILAVPWAISTRHWSASPINPPGSSIDPPGNRGLELGQRGDSVVSADFNPEKGKLLVLAIGADYKRRNVAENACKKDAENLANAFKSQQGVFFKDVRVSALLNEQANRNNILSKLNAIRDEATDGDLVVVTLAGHGTVDQDNNYYFLPYDFNPSMVLPSTGVSWDDFHRVFRPLRCMVLVIADTCHSGAITMTNTRAADDDAVKDSVNKAVNDFRQAQAGLIVIAASLAGAPAQQNQEHGFLSQAVLEGVTGVRRDSTLGDDHWPKPSSDGLITLETLQWYVINRVQTLSMNSQKVITNHSGNIHLNDIPIAIRRTSSTAPGAGVEVVQPGRTSS